MTRKTVKEVFMSFPADEGQLEDIRGSVKNVLNDSDLTLKDINSVLLAIEEVCTNVIRHAYLYAPGTIKIKITIHPGKVVFSVFDRGRRFDYDHSDTPDLGRYVKTGRKGGLGLYLIRKMMDSVSYYSRDGENELRMEKKADKKAVKAIRPPGISIRVKFALWASLVVFAIITGVFLYIDNRTEKGTYASFFRGASDVMDSFVSDLGEKIIFRDLDITKSAAAWLETNDNFVGVIVTDSANTIIADPENPKRFLSAFKPLHRKELYNSDLAITDSAGITAFHYKIPVTLNSRIVGYSYFKLLKAPLEEQVSAARKGLLAFSFGGLVIGFIAVFLLSNYFVKPIQKLTEGVLRIGEGNLDQALPVEGTDEFSEIARAFNEITDKFKRSQEDLVEQERLQKEMQVAQEIQHALLPRSFPDVEGYDISTIYRAAKDVGGDYFDFVQIDPDSMGIIVADVSGKGVPGSLVMTMIRTALRLESRENYSPTDILSRVNQFVADDVKKGMFITIFFITLDSKKRTISFASAGHNPMILYRKDIDSCYFLNTRGMPLGISLPDGVEFEQTIERDKVKLKKDDMLVIYTDGITEAMNKAGEQYGNDRLIEFIKTNADFHPDEFTAKLDADINRFTAGAPQNDDITLVVIKEKVMLDELVFEKRKRLIQMTEEENVSPEEACREMGVSVSTYYKYRRRWRESGDAGLLDKKLRADSDLKQVPYEVRKEILHIAREYPEYGTKRIMTELKNRGMGDIDQGGLYEELVRMRLNTKKLRLEYIERIGALSPEMRNELDREILKDKERKKKTEKIDRDTYLEQIKRSIGEKNKEKQAVELEIIDKLKEIEPLLGDTVLYGEIAAELAKLGGGKDLASLFEKMILKMAETKIESAASGQRLSHNEKKTEDESKDSSVKEEPRLSSSTESSREIESVEEKELGTELSPIDVSEVASEKEDADSAGEKENKIDWDAYTKKLESKYNNK
ncbi:MAG: SpoIIE family protein phosphatase [Candidatus Zixiibacteriota bacterium]|nr:MAG: SpoIIE family protein phosphatase [candidate division Zixibacteria bacterium]